MNAENDEARRMWRELEGSPPAEAVAGVPPCNEEPILDCMKLTVAHRESGRQASYLREDIVADYVGSAYKHGRADEGTRSERIHRLDRLFVWSFLATTVVLLAIVLGQIVFGGE